MWLEYGECYNLYFVLCRLVSQQRCRDIFRELDEVKVQIRDINVCADSTVGDTCQGDSGGSLMVWNSFGGLVVAFF